MYGYGFADMCPWDRDTLEYDGLGSHSPLWESPAGDLALSAEIDCFVVDLTVGEKPTILDP
jgi:hypothetical protein